MYISKKVIHCNKFKIILITCVIKNTSILKRKKLNIFIKIDINKFSLFSIYIRITSIYYDNNMIII